MRDFKIFCGCCVLSVIFIVWGFMQYLPQLADEVQRVEIMLQEKREQREALENFRNTHGDQASYEKMLTRKKMMIREKIPEKIAVGEFMTEMQLLANRSKVDIVSMTPEKVEEFKNYSSQPIMLAVQGSFPSLLEFFRGMEEGKVFIHIDNLSLSGHGNQLGCRIGLHIYGDS